MFNYNKHPTTTLMLIHNHSLNNEPLLPLTTTKNITTTWILSPTLTNKVRDKLIIDIGSYGFSTTKIDDNHLKVSGPVSIYNKTFNIVIKELTTTSHTRTHARTHARTHTHTTPLELPPPLAYKVLNILGLTTSPIAHTYYHLAKQEDHFAPQKDHLATQKDHLAQQKDILSRDGFIATRAAVPFNPLQLASLYNFPTSLDGTNQKIGIIELGGGYNMSDITTYFSMLSIPGTPNITAVSVDGAVNDPSDTSGANIEVLLDIEVIAAIVPNASIFVYFAPNSFQGFYDAIYQAINDCDIVSISWGSAEVNWGSVALSSYNTLFQTAVTKNVTVLAAAGDNGSSDGTSGTNVDFPASSPYVIACGGTRLLASGNTITSETVWNVNSTSSATGGGISKTFAKPSYQSTITYALNNKRGLPDLSANADPNTGYIIFAEGNSIVVGGTSAVSPLLSALVARLNQSLGHTIGFLQPVVYVNQGVCRDITVGNNGAYSASTGWDPCSGLGVLNGQLLLNVLNGSSPVASFTANVLTGNSPLLVSFTDMSNNNPTSWSWNFGDSSSSLSQNPTHTYTSAGVYTVSLTVSNTNGSNVYTRTGYITVTSPPLPSLKPSFNASAVLVKKGSNVVFTDTTKGTHTRLWNFGDGSTMGNLQVKPTHKYKNTGMYTVTLTVYKNGQSSSLTKTNYIRIY